MRALLFLTLGAVLVGLAMPAHAQASQLVTASVRLYAWNGHWRQVNWKDMQTSEPLRVDVWVSTAADPVTGFTVRASLRHVAWPVTHPVVEAADVRVQLRQLMHSAHVAHFQGVMHVPVTHPIEFSDIDVTVQRGSLTQRVRSGVTFEPPMTLAEAPLVLTVPQAFSFCAARPKLDYLSYGVGIRGYLRGRFSGTDGPPVYFVLAHPTTTANLATLERRHAGFSAGGFVKVRMGEQMTVVGSLVCRPQPGLGIAGPLR